MIDNYDNDEIYEIMEDIKRVDTITFDKLDLMEYYEIIGIKKTSISAHISLLFTFKIYRRKHEI